MIVFYYFIKQLKFYSIDKNYRLTIILFWIFYIYWKVIKNNKKNLITISIIKNFKLKN